MESIMIRTDTDSGDRPDDVADDRIILHFDYDCFYAQVVQNNPPPGMGMTVADLAGKPVGITQKSLLATCNYEARRRGVRKLMRIADAVRILPDLLLVDGEDLTPFRDASKALYRRVCDLLAAGSDSDEKEKRCPVPVERLGLDEVFVDATALVEANARRLGARPAASETTAFFQLGDDGRGFALDCTAVSGCVVGNASFAGHTISGSYLRLVLGSHLAAYVRHRLQTDAGYSASAGIATNKVLAKLAGKQNKPANQTTILSAGSDGDATVQAFMDALTLRSVPGIGFKTASLLSSFIKNTPTKDSLEDDDNDNLTVADVRRHPGMSPRLIASILHSAQAAGAAGAALPAAGRVWQLLHGVDPQPVRGGRDLPTQISIEDTYAGPRQGTLKPQAAGAVAAELRKIAGSLLTRMHTDLRRGGSSDGGSNSTSGWLARPRTLRLTLRPQYAAVAHNRTTEKTYHFARMSRSMPLPGYVLSLTLPREQIVERLVQGSLVPMFRRLAASVRVGGGSGGGGGGSSNKEWTVGLLNVCVANMAAVADDGGIAAMFRRANAGDDHDHVDPISDNNDDNVDPVSDDDDDDDSDDNHELVGWDNGDTGAEGTMCRQCGQYLPVFAQAAHARFHMMGED